MELAEVCYQMKNGSRDESESNNDIFLSLLERKDGDLEAYPEVKCTDNEDNAIILEVI